MSAPGTETEVKKSSVSQTANVSSVNPAIGSKASGANLTGARKGSQLGTTNASTVKTAKSNKISPPESSTGGDKTSRADVTKKASIKSTKMSSSSSGGKNSLVEAAIASVVYPVRSNGLIDILVEPRPPLPVELPPLPEIRLKVPKDEQEKQQPKLRKSVKIDEDMPVIEGDNIPNPFAFPRNVEQFIQMLDKFKAEVMDT